VWRETAHVAVQFQAVALHSRAAFSASFSSPSLEWQRELQTDLTKMDALGNWSTPSP
jgi:hypothetical protein